MSLYNETLSPETETHLHFYFYFVFLPCDCMRKMYVSMSVRPSVKRVNCDKTIGWTLLVTIRPIGLLRVCFYNVPANKMQVINLLLLCVLWLFRVCFLECSLCVFFVMKSPLAVLSDVWYAQTAMTNIQHTDTSQNTYKHCVSKKPDSYRRSAYIRLVFQI